MDQEAVAKGGMVAVYVAVVVVAVAWVARRFNEWWYLPSAVPHGAKLPPGSLGWPFIGNMLSFVRLYKGDPEAYFHHHFLSRNKECGDGIYKAHLFGSPSIITSTSEMNKFVLAAESAFAPGWPSPELVGRSCMVIVEGIQHKRMRRLLLEAVSHPAALRKTLRRQENRFKNTLTEWTQQRNITLRERLKKVAFEDICDAFLGVTSPPLIKEMMDLSIGLIAGLRAYPINVPGFTYHHSLKCRKRLMDIMFTVVKHRRHAGPKLEAEDFLDVLLKTKDEEGNYLTDLEICDNIASFLLAGHESTSYTILWSMVLLAKNPKILSKLRDEHKALQSQKEGDWFADLKKTPYTNLVQNEVLRFVNIAPFVFRTVKEDVNYQGYYFPKGWKVIVWLRASHMDPTNFTDPHTFNPERFEEHTLRTGLYMPFGHGPRLCPGNTLALLSSRLFLHILATSYKWSLVNPNVETTYLPHPKPKDGGEIVFEPL
ncbi:hypothetical protein GOP47_0007027 [Adiantum capillus-veneris]|uniref:Uncharacterized protein n=1 Tax=Adiantum capillus-veneris TaxID=13818 RepID=A0A9D4V043_ADICA|nr:hypothetical protein GOP47_0007027 [Adiantum capillus-veneris]